MCSSETEIMSKLRDSHLYVAGILIFLTIRLYSGTLFGIGGIVGFGLFVLGMRWGVNSYVLGRDMPLPSFQSSILVKGTDDPARFLLFSVCVFLCYASATGPVD